MRYLLDSNILIDANRDYYPRKRVPEFWNWLLHQASNEIVKIPCEMYNEITTGNDALVEWVKDQKDVLILSEEAKLDLVRKVVSQGYAPDLNESELVQVGHDPFIIAYALDSKVESTVVTTEVSKPSRLPVLIIRVYNSGLEGVLGSGGFDAEAIHGGVRSG